MAIASRRVAQDLPVDRRHAGDRGAARVRGRARASIDMHVHLREPGQEHKETVATGAAVRGGRRVHRRRLHAEHVARQRQRRGHEFILKKAPRGRAGARLPDRRGLARLRRASSSPTSRELHAAGCVAVTDDGRPVATALLMRRALEYTRHVRRAGHRPLRGSVAQGRRRGARGLPRRRARPARHPRRGRSRSWWSAT